MNTFEKIEIFCSDYNRQHIDYMCHRIILKRHATSDVYRGQFIFTGTVSYKGIKILIIITEERKQDQKV